MGASVNGELPVFAMVDTTTICCVCMYLVSNKEYIPLLSNIDTTVDEYQFDHYIVQVNYRMPSLNMTAEEQPSQPSTSTTIQH